VLTTFAPSCCAPADSAVTRSSLKWYVILIWLIFWHFGIMIVFNKLMYSINVFFVKNVSLAVRTRELSLYRWHSVQEAMLKIWHPVLYHSLKIKTTSSDQFTTVHANLIEQTTSSIRTCRFETLYSCCHQERFQMFITTQIGATSTKSVVKRDLQNFGSTYRSLRKCWANVIYVSFESNIRRCCSKRCSNQHL